MASLFRSSLPDHLQSVLDYRSSVTESDCPEDVKTTLSKLSFFTSGGSVSGAAVGGAGAAGRSRFTNLSGSGTWRPTGSSSSDHDGFQTYTRRRGTGPSSSGSQDRTNRDRDRGSASGGAGGGRYHHQWTRPSASKSSAPAAVVSAPVAVDKVTAAVGGAGAPEPVTAPVVPTTPPAVVEPTAIAFSSAAIKANLATEDRILAKVKGKINKIGVTTYDATKTFMQQILDSDETDFLDDFMKFVFQKAATESVFCPLYARLLHELADEFTHLRDVMRTLFRDYMFIFMEVEHTAPDTSSESYKQFVEAQERKKFRRGYSQFVAELVKHGEVDMEAFRTLLFQIVSTIEEFHTDSSKTQLSEEYIDCLSNMCKSASPILVANSWSGELITRLAALISKPAASLPGFTNKARFTLMNLKDYAARGWK